MTKVCERCGRKLPDDFTNLLCEEHYAALLKEQEERDKAAKEQRDAEILKNPDNPTHPDNLTETVPVSGEAPEAVQRPTEVVCDHSNCGILDPNYKENPEADDKNQVLANIAQFIYTHRDSDHPKGRKHGILLYYPQRNMYNFIKNYCIKQATSHPQYPKHLWKPKIVDVGCGSGVGSNILSQEADFVWGIDKNEWSIEFAKEAFTREKNGLYYSPQVTFDIIDIMTDNREFQAFDVVTAIEVIEHIWDVHGFLTNIKRFAKKDKKGQVIKDHGTVFFISSPNRNNQKIRKDRPENPYHVREWKSEELKALLLRHFEQVDLMNHTGEPVPDDTTEQVIFAKCTNAIL